MTHVALVEMLGKDVNVIIPHLGRNSNLITEFPPCAWKVAATGTKSAKTKACTSFLHFKHCWDTASWTVLGGHLEQNKINS